MKLAFLDRGHIRRELFKQILSQFQQSYQAAGEPEGAMLYEVVEDGGHTFALCFNPAAVELCPQLLEQSYPWYERDSVGGLRWLAGDKRLIDP